MQTENFSKWRAFLISITVFILLIVVLEAFLRISKIQSDNFLKQDPVLGWFHQSNFTGRSVSKEYSVVKHLNNHGFVDTDDYSYEKPKDVYRVVVLGDSAAEALQVKDGEAYVNLLEDKLNNLGSKIRYEVLNLGVSSYGTVKEDYLFGNYGLKYNPDLVILAFWVGNDIYDNLNEEISPHAEFSKKQKFLNSIKLFIRNNFAVFRFYREMINRNIVLSYLRGNLKKSGKAGSIYDFKYDDSIQSAIEKTQFYIKKINDLARSNKTEFLVVILPEKSQAHKQFRAPGDENLDFKKPNEVLAKFLQKEKIVYLDLLPNFINWAKMNPNSSAFFPIDGHNNEAGHRIIAEALFKYLIKYVF